MKRWSNLCMSNFFKSDLLEKKFNLSCCERWMFAISLLRWRSQRFDDVRGTRAGQKTRLFFKVTHNCDRWWLQLHTRHLTRKQTGASVTHVIRAGQFHKPTGPFDHCSNNSLFCTHWLKIFYCNSIGIYRYLW